MELSQYKITQANCLLTDRNKDSAGSTQVPCSSFCIYNCINSNLQSSYFLTNSYPVLFMFITSGRNIVHWICMYVTQIGECSDTPCLYLFFLRYRIEQSYKHDKFKGSLTPKFTVSWPQGMFLKDPQNFIQYLRLWIIQYWTNQASYVYLLNPHINDMPCQGNCMIHKF
jgi:hypothetical protein